MLIYKVNAIFENNAFVHTKRKHSMFEGYLFSFVKNKKKVQFWKTFTFITLFAFQNEGIWYVKVLNFTWGSKISYFEHFTLLFNRNDIISAITMHLLKWSLNVRCSSVLIITVNSYHGLIISIRKYVFLIWFNDLSMF